MLVGIGDDAAVVEPERNRARGADASTRSSKASTSIGAFTPPDAIGHRALAVNLSDLAAMGAAPRLALLSLALPAGAARSHDFDAMIAGLAALAARHRVHVVGGNLTRSPGPLTIDVTVSGTVKRRQALTRAGARPGDELYVTGTIGARGRRAADARKAASDRRHRASNGPAARAALLLYPEPRVRTRHAARPEPRAPAPAWI